jgi:hypothetical protein
MGDCAPADVAMANAEKVSARAMSADDIEPSSSWSQSYAVRLPPGYGQGHAMYRIKKKLRACFWFIVGDILFAFFFLVYLGIVWGIHSVLFPSEQ